MEINEIKEQLDIRLSIRDTMDIAKSELADLEEDENVRRYIELSKYCGKYGYLEQMPDDAILDEIISVSEEVPELADTYFCFGKDFNGLPKKIGGYYIGTRNGYRFAVKVSQYRKLSGSSENIIIPTRESEDFEQHHTIIHAQTSKPEEEYRIIRREAYKRLMGLKEQETTLGIQGEGPKLVMKKAE